MDRKQLAYFVTVVEQTSFSKAAHTLHISQPSLSNAIKNLEDEVGCKLLERTTRTIRVTEQGQLLYERALQILLDMSIMEKEMQEARVFGKGELRIGMIESVKHWIPKVVRTYEEDYPGMHLFLTEELGGEDVKRSLRQYKSHAIITNQVIDEEDIHTIPLYKEKLVLVLHESHPLAERENIALRELKDEPLIITSEGFQTREDVLAAFTAIDIQPYIQYEVERLETAMSLILENLGVSLIPENYLADRKDARLVHKSLDAPTLERAVYLTYMKDRYMAPAIQAFIEQTISYFHERR